MSLYQSFCNLDFFFFNVLCTLGIVLGEQPGSNWLLFLPRRQPRRGAGLSAMLRKQHASSLISEHASRIGACWPDQKSAAPTGPVTTSA